MCFFKGSVDNGYYDGYYGDSGRTIETPPYTDIVLKSSVTQSITYHLGGPVTQPSTMIQLRREATVQCRPNMTYYHRHIFTTCNVTECLFDIVNDPCEMKNVADAYPRVSCTNIFILTNIFVAIEKIRKDSIEQRRFIRIR